jgi:hypothetical protein
MPIDDNEPNGGVIATGPASPQGVATNTSPTYIKIAVPNFNGATGSAPQMQSYLRLGAIETDVAPGRTNAQVNGIDITGEDLASVVRGFADDSRARKDPMEPSSGNPAPLETTPLGDRETGFIERLVTLPDGRRVPIDQPLPFGPELDDPSGRGLESSILHTKGGWRDHSDGNRITTTRGDKVEVIRGNYKMVVLGRRDPLFPATTPGVVGTADPTSSAGWDVSGGLVDAADPALVGQTALNTEYLWEKNSDGRWGWTMRSLIGQYPTTPPTGAGNGRTLSYTWADEIRTYIGSPNPDRTFDTTVDEIEHWVDVTKPSPVKRLLVKTWAETIVQETHAVAAAGTSPSTTPSITTTTTTTGDMTNSQHADGGMTNNTSAGSITNNMSANGEIHNLTTADGDIAEAVAAVGTHTTLDTSLNIFNFALAALLFELKVLHVDLHAGIHMDLHVGMHFDWHAFDDLHIEIDGTHLKDSQNITEMAISRIGTYSTLSLFSDNTSIF